MGAPRRGSLNPRPPPRGGPTGTHRGWFLHTLSFPQPFWAGKTASQGERGAPPPRPRSARPSRLKPLRREGPRVKRNSASPGRSPATTLSSRTRPPSSQRQYGSGTVTQDSVHEAPSITSRFIRANKPRSWWKVGRGASRWVSANHDQWQRLTLCLLSALGKGGLGQLGSHI